MHDYFRSREAGEFLERQALVLIIAALALFALFGNGRLDLAIERWFYDESLRGFPFTNHWLLKDVLHDAARIVSAMAALLLLALTVGAWLVPCLCRLRSYRSELLYAAVASLAATLVVGVLKHYSAQVCPWDLQQFGGSAAYHPLLYAQSSAAGAQGCLPASHPLSGYAWLAAGFALRPHAPTLARRSWLLAFLLGTALGAVQVARGAHFSSHVLWTAWASWAVNIALLTVYARISRRDGPARTCSEI